MKKKRIVTLLTSLCLIISQTSAAFAGTWSFDGTHWHNQENGVNKTGWYSESANDWYHLGTDGNMKTGWFEGFHFHEAHDGKLGHMDTGWYFDGKSWYFLNNQHDGTYGHFLAGWQWIDGYCYCFNSDGVMYAGTTTPDGYTVDADGHWIVNGIVQFVQGKGISTKTFPRAGSSTSSSPKSSGGSGGGGGGGGGGGSSSGGGNSSDETSLPVRNQWRLSAEKKELTTNAADNKVIFTLDAAGDAVSKVFLKNTQTSVSAEMFDDGNIDEHGDDIANDGVYSCIAAVNVSNVARITFFAAAEFESTKYKSNDIVVNIYEQLTESDLNTMVSVIDDSNLEKAVSEYAKAHIEGDAASEKANIDKLLANKKKEGSLTSYSWDSEQKVISLRFPSGVTHLIIFDDLSDKVSVEGTTASVSNAEKSGTAQVLATDSDADELLDGVIDNDVLSQSEKTDTLQDTAPEVTAVQKDQTSERAERKVDDSMIVEYPQIWNLTEAMGGAGRHFNIGGQLKNNKAKILTLYSKSKTGSTISGNDTRVSYVENTEKLFKNNGSYNCDLTYNATVDDYAQLQDYSVIILNGHGTLLNFGSKKIPALCVYESTSKSKLKHYDADLKANNIYSVTWGNEGIDGYAVMPKFFSYHYGNGNDLYGSMVYCGSCHGYETDDFADAFIDSGALAFIGYDYTVFTHYSGMVIYTLIDKMLSKELSLESALQEIRKEFGADDYTYVDPGKKYSKSDTKADYKSAYLKWTGDKLDEIYLSHYGIKNGDFENDLLGWTTEGDARVISKLGTLNAPHGRMAIISTGLGSVDDSNSYIYQTFKVPMNAAELSVKYDVVSEEPMEFVNTEYDDTFELYIEHSDGTRVLLEKVTVNEANWKELGGDYFSEGDETTYHTGWVSFTTDIIAKYRGETISLVGFVHDNGDSLWDTAVLLDDIKIK